MNKKYTRRKPIVNRPNHVSVRVSDEMLIDIQHIMQLEEHKTQTQAVLELLEEGIKRYYINRLRNGQEVVMPSYMRSKKSGWDKVEDIEQTLKDIRSGDLDLLTNLKEKSNVI